VQVFDADETKIFTTILAIPNYRLDPAERTVLNFAERPRSDVEALRAWFYPGDNFGQEFVYPKARAVTLAQEVKSPVLAAPVTLEETPEELLKAPVEAVEPKPTEEVATEEHRWTAPEPTPVVEPEPAPVAKPIEAPVPSELPKTAGELPAIALIGVVSLGVAVLLRRVS
jgi:hypothetical protein